MFYKLPSSKRWLGQATVIGIESKSVIIVKHGDAIHRVHPCHLQKVGNLWTESLNNVSRNIANVAENDGRRAATKDIQSVCRSLECIEENNITVWDNDNETVVDSTNNDASSNGLLTDSDCANDVDGSSKSLTKDIIPNGQCSVNNSAGVKLPER